MKKLIALLLALTMLCSACAALADVWGLDGTNLTIELPSDVEEDDVDDDDAEEYGQVAALCTADESLEICIYMNDADYTLQEIKEYLEEEYSEVTAGFTTINGIEVLYYTYVEEGYTCLSYIVIDSGIEVEIEFWFADATGGNQSKSIIETLSNK